jgi:2-polyprenyl-3-methyl-5-hydroxy-6-metoxy-1,4-benzoquinol methylase
MRDKIQFEIDFWNKRYSSGRGSGKGSRNGELAFKVRTISDLISENGIKSIIDVGCGDGILADKIIRKTNIPYHGLDISDEAIRINSTKYPHLRFGLLDTSDFAFRADLLLCVDVLFHIKSDEIFHEVLRSINRSYDKMAIISNYDDDFEINKDGSHMARRKYNVNWIDGFVKKIDIPMNPAKALFVYMK